MRSVALFVIAVLLLALLPTVPPAKAQTLAIVNVGDAVDLASRNPLIVLLGSSPDEVSPGILEPVYSRLVLLSLQTREPLPYIAKGVDADGDGQFETQEYGVFGKDGGTDASDITVYLDLNGVRWHDGTQVAPMDVLFSFVLASLSPRQNTSLRALWSDPTDPASFWANRHLNLGITYCAPTEAQWQGVSALPGSPSLRCALRFQLAYPYPSFYSMVLGGMRLFPRHIWEGTGGARHADLGRAVYPESDPRGGQGIPLSETSYTPFDYHAAEAWIPSDQDVIGSGPFRFTVFERGVHTSLTRNIKYYVGLDPDTGAVYDGRLAAVIHQPYADGITFAPLRTYQLGVQSLKDRTIDYLRRNLPPEWVPDLLNVQPVQIHANASLGFTYLAYNMRLPYLGYNSTTGGDAADSGRPFRLASAHVIDKNAFLGNLLQNWGVLADSVVSPGNLFWHNDTLPQVSYNLNAARTILDNAGWIDSDGDGWREIPTIGDAQVSILVPMADYDPFLAAAGMMWASGLRSVGLDVTATPTAYDPVRVALETYSFELAVGSWPDPGPNPDYLHAYYHCSNRNGGLNYPGYCDTEFDRVIDLARTEMDPVKRQRLVRWAQGILMEDRPVEPLTVPMAIQATRSDRFVNWSSEFGDLWNYWSWIGVRWPRNAGTLRLTVTSPGAMASGGQDRIYVRLAELEHGTAVADASVTLRILTGDGGEFLETSSTQVTGTTDANGRFSVGYVAPTVTGASARNIAIEATAHHGDFLMPAQRTVLITVFPAGVRFLGIRVSFPAGDIALLGSPIPLHVEVSDETGQPVSDANVSATVDPPNGTLSRTNGTAAEMASIVLTTPTDLRANETYRISLTATMDGYFPGYANVTVMVLNLTGGGGPPHPQEEVPWLGIAAVAGLATITVVALAWALARRRTRRREESGPPAGPSAGKP